MTASVTEKTWPGRAFWILWVLLIAVLVHVDWHVGRPHHMRFSLDLDLHWTLGAVTGCLLAWHASRAAPEHALPAFLIVSLAGLFFGHIGEGLGEVVFYKATPVEVFPALRWTLFLQFAAALLVAGTCTLIALHAQRQRLSVRA